MRNAKRFLITVAVCAGMLALAWYAWLLPFFEFSEEYSAEQVGSFLSLDYLRNLIPLGLIGRLFGGIDRTYGYEKRSGTDFIVTSGISNWAVHFKTGTRSEYVIITVRGK